MSYYINVNEVKLNDGLGIYKENEFQKYLEDVGFDKYITENNTIDITKLMTTYCATNPQKLQFDIRYDKAFKYNDQQLFNGFMSDMPTASYEIYAEFPMIQYQSQSIDKILLPGTSPHIGDWSLQLGPWNYVQSWYRLNRTAAELTIAAAKDLDGNTYYKKYEPSDFPDGVIPLRLFAMCCGGGGGGSASGGSYAGGGGGGGGVVAKVVPIDSSQYNIHTECLYIRPGQGGEGGDQYGANGGDGYDSYIGSDSNSGATIKNGMIIAHGGKGGHNTDYNGTGGIGGGYADRSNILFQCNGGNGGNKENNGQNPQQNGGDFTGGDIVMFSDRTDKNRSYTFTQRKGGEARGTEDFRGGGGGASALGSGGNSVSGFDHLPGEDGGLGAGGAGGALIIMGANYRSGGNGGDGKIILYY